MVTIPNTLITQCMYVLLMILRTKTYYYPQNDLAGICDREAMHILLDGN
jgi:hypothetical protein